MLRGGFHYLDCGDFDFYENHNQIYFDHNIIEYIIKNKKPIMLCNLKINHKEYNPIPLVPLIFNNSYYSFVNTKNTRFQVSISGTFNWLIIPTNVLENY